jgi:hypothetical protein
MLIVQKLVTAFLINIFFSQSVSAALPQAKTISSSEAQTRAR